MKIKETDMKGLFTIERDLFSDHRGDFSRLFCQEELNELLGGGIVQTNYSLTRDVGSLRGMHFQYPPFAEKKLLTCLSGSVYDVIVDLRKGSETFLQWKSFQLSPESALSILIPEGCAHGFQVISKDALLIYQHTSYYKPSFEGGVHHMDPKFNIQWPLDPLNVSDRDQNHPLIDKNFGIEL